MYTEMGCSPVYKLGTCCPIKYECPDFSARRRDKCFYNGMEFGVNERIPDALTKKNCAPSCICTQ